ncbi:hypothetical protein ACS0TY_035369 [Phlomoides rotata]
MSFRGRDRGRGGFGGSFRPKSSEIPFEPFPEIQGLGTAEYSTTAIKLVRWSTILQKDLQLSPFYIEDRSEHPKQQKPDIERYSDRQSPATKVKPPLWDVIRLDTDHMPAELARGEGNRLKKLKLTSVSGDDWNKLEHFEELEQKRGTGKKEEEEEEEEVVGEEDEGEFSDEGDYEQAEYCDDDEDDFNMADDNDDEPCY